MSPVSLRKHCVKPAASVASNPDLTVKIIAILELFVEPSTIPLPHEYDDFMQESTCFEALLHTRSRDHRAVILSNISILQPAPHYGCQIEIFTSPYTVRFDHHYHRHSVRHGYYHESCQFYTSLVITHTENTTIFAMPPLWNQLHHEKAAFRPR